MAENLCPSRTRTKSKNKTFAHVTPDKRSIHELPLNQEIISGGVSNSLTTLIWRHVVINKIAFSNLKPLLKRNIRFCKYVKRGSQRYSLGLTTAYVMLSKRIQKVCRCVNGWYTETYLDSIQRNSNGTSEIKWRVLVGSSQVGILGQVCLGPS